MENSKVILQGSSNEHKLVGNFEIEDDASPFTKITLNGNCVLRHVEPGGNKEAEHRALRVDSGVWHRGRQVEFNPFSGDVVRVWD